MGYDAAVYSDLDPFTDSAIGAESCRLLAAAAEVDRGLPLSHSTGAGALAWAFVVARPRKTSGASRGRAGHPGWTAQRMQDRLHFVHRQMPDQPRPGLIRCAPVERLFTMTRTYQRQRINARPLDGRCRQSSSSPQGLVTAPNGSDAPNCYNRRMGGSTSPSKGCAG